METISSKDIQRAGAYALRHYVSFSYYARTPGTKEKLAQACVCSAFAMRVRNSIALVSAGHVLDDIEAEQRAGLELVSFRLWDGWSLGAPHKNYVPFDFHAAPKLRVNTLGLDYGLIMLGPL